jgi:membrane protein implicated in regulation of membrane protease activity
MKEMPTWLSMIAGATLTYMSILVPTFIALFWLVGRISLAVPLTLVVFVAIALGLYVFTDI